MKFPFGRAAWREIKAHPGRYLAVLAIVALGVGFYAGLFVIEDAMLDTADHYLDEYNLYDFSVSSALGLYEEDVEALSRVDGIRRAEGVITRDAICRKNKNGADHILHFISITESINRPEVIAGRMPRKPNECLADVGRYTEDDIGQKILLQEADDAVFAYTEYTIVGIARSVEYINYQRGSSSLGSGSVTAFCYIPREGFSADYFTAVYLDADIDAHHFSDDYQNAIEALRADVEDTLTQLAQQRGKHLLEQAHGEIEKGVAAYEQGKIELEQARAQAEQQFAEAEAQLADGYAQLQAGKQALAEAERTVELAKEKASAEYAAAMQQADRLTALADRIGRVIDYDKYLEVLDALTQLEEARLCLLTLIEENPDNEQYPVLLERVTTKQQQITEEYAVLLAAVSRYHDLRTKAQDVRNTAQETYDTLDLAATAMITMQKMQIDNAETEWTVAQKRLNAERISAEREFAAAEQTLADALAQLTLPEDLQALTQPKTYVLTRNQNLGYVSMDTNSSIISGVVVVFPVFFVLVAALVCSTVMTRMVEDERTALGTLKAMGYGKGALMRKYLLYAGSASLIGSVAGFFIGTFAMPRMLWLAYSLMFDFTDTLMYVFNPTLLVLCVLVALLCCMGTAALCVLSAAGQMPAQLMRPRVSVSGKRVFFERIPFLWKPLPFLSKVALRNIWRYKKRLLVMLLGIGGSTALLVAGFGLADSIKPLADYQYEDVSLYDYEITFKDPMDEQSLAAFTERTQEQIGSLIAIHQSEQTVYGAHKSYTATLYACDSLDGYIALLHDGQSVPFPEAGQAVINPRLAEMLQVDVGDTIKVATPDGEIQATVSGIADNYIGNVVYLSTQTYTQATGRAPEIKTALAIAAKGAEIDRTAAKLRSDESVAYLEAGADMQDMLGTMMQSMNYVVIVVIVSAGALAYIVLFNLTNINITERTREIATLRVIGLYRGETRRYVMTENYVLSVVGALAGIPAGILLHRFVMSKIVLDAITFPTVVHPLSYLYSFLLTILFAVLVGVALRPRIDRIPMAESLKSVE